MSEPLTDLINLVFHNETFPDACKIAKIRPLYKKGRSLDCNNYHPVSLLSNIGKIIETLRHKCLYSFFEQSKCFYNLQFVHRHLHLTKHALISRTEQIKTSLNENNFQGLF